MKGSGPGFEHDRFRLCCLAPARGGPSQPAAPCQGTALLLHRGHGAGLGAVSPLAMLSGAHPKPQLPGEGSQGRVGEAGRLGMGLAPCLLLPPRPSTSPEQSLGLGGTTRGWVHLPTSAARCTSHSQLGAAPPARLIAVQPVLPSLPCRCRSLEWLLIAGTVLGLAARQS